MSHDTILLHSTYALHAPRQIGTLAGRPIMGCAPKQPVPDQLTQIDATGLSIDRQDKECTVHGGRDTAMFVWTLANYAALKNDGGRDYLAGATANDPYRGGRFGENLLVHGAYANEDHVRIGDVWAWGDRHVEVTGPREPCSRLGIASPGSTAWMMQTGHCGWYLKLINEPGPAPTHGAQLQLLRVGDGPTVAEAFKQVLERYDTIGHAQKAKS